MLFVSVLRLRHLFDLSRVNKVVDGSFSSSSPIYIIYRRGKRTFSLTRPFASACLLRGAGGKEERVPCTSLQRLFYVIASKIACQTCLDGDFSVPQRPAVPFSECKITDFLRTDQGVWQLFFILFIHYSSNDVRVRRK
jgi:hypothetical protein